MLISFPKFKGHVTPTISTMKCQRFLVYGPCFLISPNLSATSLSYFSMKVVSASNKYSIVLQTFRFTSIQYFLGYLAAMGTGLSRTVSDNQQKPIKINP